VLAFGTEEFLRVLLYLGAVVERSEVLGLRVGHGVEDINRNEHISVPEQRIGKKDTTELLKSQIGEPRAPIRHARVGAIRTA
jgi:hypothetical protein